MIDLQRHIISQASHHQIDVGLHIWSKDYLHINDLDLEEKEALFYYTHSRKDFMVTVAFTDHTVESSCECIHPMFSICEHQVAAILALAELLDIVVFPEYPKKTYAKGDYINNQMPTRLAEPEKDKTPVRKNAFQPFELTPSNDLKEVLKSARKPHTSFGYGPEIKDMENHLRDSGFYFEARTRYYEPFSTVRFFRKNDKWFTECSCRERVAPLCPHEYLVIEKAVKDWNLPHLLDTAREEANVRNVVLQEFKIAPSDVEKYFQLGFAKGKFYYKAIERGMLGKSQQRRALGKLSEIRDLSLRLKRDIPKAKENTEERTYALVFFATSGNVVAVVTGKPSKRSILSSHIQTHFHLDLPPAWAPVTEWLRTMEEIETHTEIENIYGDLPSTDTAHAHIALLHAIPFIRTIPVFLSKVLFRVSKNAISPLTISEHFADLHLDVVESGDYYQARPMLVLGDQVISLTETKDLMTTSIMAIHQSTVYFYPSLAFADLISYFNGLGVISYLKSMSMEFFQLVHELAKSVRINFSIKIKHKEVQLKSTASRVYLHEENGQIVFVPKVVYGEDKEIPVLQTTEEVELNSKKVTHYLRDRKFEQQFLDQLYAFIPDFKSMEPQGLFYLPVMEVTDKRWFFRFIQWAAENQVEIFGQNELPSLKYSTKFPRLNLQLASGIDWFNTSVEVHYDHEQISLAQLKRVFNQGDEFVRLKDGSLGIIPDEWRSKLEKLFRVGTISGDTVKVPKLQFMIIDELFDQIDEEAIKEEIAMKKQRLVSFERIGTAQLPIAVTADLRPYQKEGFHWLCFLQEYGFGGCLADDMGLGKTLQVLCVLARAVEAKAKTSLIVVPRSLLFNWENEILKFCPTLNYTLHHGGQRWQTEIETYDVVISTYGTVMRDIETLSKLEFEYVILDESQAIKNPDSKTYKAVRLLQANYRLVMTGTPVENNTFDLYAQMSFANPGLLGTQKAFLDNYVKPIDLHQDSDRAKELQRMIHPFVLRRTKGQVAPELPAKTEQILYCEMQPDQRKLYELYRQKYARELDELIEEKGLSKSKIYIIEGLTRLRQICNAPVLVSADHARVSSEKLDVLIEQLVNVVPNHKALVFSQFVQMLKQIEKRLQEAGIQYYYLDGQTKDRKTIVEEFQTTDKNCVFLISLKAGGTGLNLTSAEYVFIVDPWWNPATEQQAIDRTHRIGQDKPVMAYKMICKDSIEEKIMKLQDRKKAIAADIIKTEDSMIKSLTREDIANLFSA